MKKVRLAGGIHWLEVPEYDLRILCGCPADTVKHLLRRGFIHTMERNGVVFETGPNAILLSDVSVQNGEFANLAEFPVLQMLYRQGMLIPGHPNNNGSKPLIIGTPEQVTAQLEYIYRGNYGLISKDELIAAGVTPDLAAEYMRIKETFAFGKIRRPEELIDVRIIRNDPVELVPGVDIERVANNTYRISSGGNYEEVGLNLDRSEQYAPSYILSQHKVKPEYFSIVHTGEGDGWDPNRPCMAAIVVFQGRIYLIDAGPSVIYTLNALGISVNQISGIFHTHAHDDHFAGLTSLVRADHRLRYFATPMVRASVTKKLAALMSFPEEEFEDFFEPHDLVENEWNMIDGLEVRPVYSPHPVDTTIMFFRAFWNDEYRTYGHFADICTMAQLDNLMRGCSPRGTALAEQIRKDYFTRVDVKKIDVGGGMIHGEAEDFRGDPSNRLVLSHRSTPLNNREKEIGANTSFGMQDVLIRAAENTNPDNIRKYLDNNFPDAAAYDLAMLANCPARTFSIGSILHRKGTVPETVHLLLDGLIEVIDADADVANLLTPGSMFGELNALSRTALDHTYRAASFINVLEIPAGMYRRFIDRCGLESSILGYLKRKQFLMRTYLLGDRISGVNLNHIAQQLQEAEIRAGETVFLQQTLALVARGQLEARCRGRRVTVIATGEVASHTQHLPGRGDQIDYVAMVDTLVYRLPSEILDQIPIVRWKLLEQFNRLRRSCEALTQ